MSVKNKKLEQLKFFKWTSLYYGDFKRINGEDYAKIPGFYDIIKPLVTQVDFHYWFALTHDMDFILGLSIPIIVKEAIKKFSKKNKNLEFIDRKILEKTLIDFVLVSLKIWRLVVSNINDLYALYREYNKVLTEREFVLLDLWFDSLPVLDELMLIFHELVFFHDTKKLKLYFEIHPAYRNKAFQADTNDIFLKEPTEENLKFLNCEHWSKQDYVDYIYKQFSKINVNILHEWLIYKKIENVYTTKESFVYAYITNSVNGLKSLSMSTLKLLAINPILDLDYVRVLHKERNLYHKQLWDSKGPMTPDEMIVDVFSTIFKTISPAIDTANNKK